MVTRHPIQIWFCKHPQQVVSSLMLAGILLSGTMSPQAVNAAPAILGTSVSELGKQAQQSDRLPRPIANAVRRDLARRLQVPIGRLRVIQYNRETWSDGCLGMPSPNEICVMALTEGWHVTVSDGRSSWTYRTDAAGQTIRQESEDAIELPQDVTDRVLAIAARQLGVSPSSLRIAQSEPQVWNGCLGIDPGLNGACTEIAISGWRILVLKDQQAWIYHTNANGSDVRLNSTASQSSNSGAAIPTFMAAQDIPANPQPEVVFRAIASGGFAGQTYETVLMRDGRVLRSHLTGPTPTAQTELRRISQQQVDQFQQMLAQQQFMNFDRISYPTTTGADYITVTLTGRGTTTQYADMIQDQLPPSLRQVIQAWDRIARSR